MALGFGVMSPVLPVYARAFGVSSFLVGLVVSSMSIMRLMAMPASGASVTRVGPRELAIAGLVLISITTALIGVSDSYWGVLAWRGLSGVGSAMWGVGSMSLLFAAAPAELRGRANSLYSGGFVLGGMAGPAVGGLLSGISIHLPFFFYAATLALCALVLGVFLPSTRPDAGAPRAAPSVRLAQSFRDPRFRAALAMSFANGWQSHGVRALVVPMFVVEALGLSTVEAGVAFALAAVAQACCLPLIGWLVDHAGRRRMLLGGAILAAATGPCLVAWRSFPVLVVFLCVYAVGASAVGSASQAMLADTVPATAGSSLSAYQMAGDSGLILGPLAAGAVMDVAPVTLAMTLGSVIFVASAALAWRTPRTPSFP